MNTQFIPNQYPQSNVGIQVSAQANEWAVYESYMRSAPIFGYDALSQQQKFSLFLSWKEYLNLIKSIPYINSKEFVMGNFMTFLNEHPPKVQQQQQLQPLAQFFAPQPLQQQSQFVQYQPVNQQTYSQNPMQSSSSIQLYGNINNNNNILLQKVKQEPCISQPPQPQPQLLQPQQNAFIQTLPQGINCQIPQQTMVIQQSLSQPQTPQQIFQQQQQQSQSIAASPMSPVSPLSSQGIIYPAQQQQPQSMLTSPISPTSPVSPLSPQGIIYPAQQQQQPQSMLISPMSPTSPVSPLSPQGIIYPTQQQQQQNMLIPPSLPQPQMYQQPQSQLQKNDIKIPPALPPQIPQISSQLLPPLPQQGSMIIENNEHECEAICNDIKRVFENKQGKISDEDVMKVIRATVQTNRVLNNMNSLLSSKYVHSLNPQYQVIDLFVFDGPFEYGSFGWKFHGKNYRTEYYRSVSRKTLWLRLYTTNSIHYPNKFLAIIFNKDKKQSSQPQHQQCQQLPVLPTTFPKPPPAGYNVHPQSSIRVSNLNDQEMNSIRCGEDKTKSQGKPLDIIRKDDDEEQNNPKLPKEAENIRDEIMGWTFSYTTREKPADQKGEVTVELIFKVEYHGQGKTKEEAIENVLTKVLRLNGVQYTGGIMAFEKLNATLTSKYGRVENIRRPRTEKNPDGTYRATLLSYMNYEVKGNSYEDAYRKMKSERETIEAFVRNPPE